MVQDFLVRAGFETGMRTALLQRSEPTGSVFCGVASNSPDSLIKDILETFLSKGGALKVPDETISLATSVAHTSRKAKIPNSVNLLAALDPLRVGDGRHSLLAESSDSLGIIAQIQLGADKDDRDVRSVVGDFGVPLQAARRY